MRSTAHSSRVEDRLEEETVRKKQEGWLRWADTVVTVRDHEAGTRAKVVERGKEGQDLGEGRR